MLPVVAGRAATARQILVYSVLLTVASTVPWALGFAGAIYAATAATCGTILVALALQPLNTAQVVAAIPGFAVTYPAGKIGGKSEVGIPAMYIPIPPAKEYYLDYEVFFDSGWVWVKGGKLPGLVGGSPGQGRAGWSTSRIARS